MCIYTYVFMYVYLWRGRGGEREAFNEEFPFLSCTILIIHDSYVL